MTEENYCSRFIDAKESNCVRMSINSTQPSLAATFTFTRLGNQLSAFATLYSIWRRFGIYNYINTDQLNRLSEVFDLPKSKSDCIDDWPYFIWEPSKHQLINYSMLD